MEWTAAANSVLDACTNAFGEGVTYKVGGTNAISIRGIFSSVYTAVDPGLGVPVTTNKPNIGIKLGDLPAKPSKSDLVVIRGTSYRVTDSQEDGNGGALLVLQKI